MIPRHILLAEKVTWSNSFTTRDHNPVLHAESCVEGEVRLNNLFNEDIENFYRNPTQFPSSYYIKDELSRGKVEVCVSGTWGTVCRGDTTWNDQSASVACSQLGFSRWGEH